jgi:hypothetical protein
MHPRSYKLGIRGSFIELKRPKREAGRVHPSGAENNDALTYTILHQDVTFGRFQVQQTVLPLIALMMEAVRTSETSVNSHQSTLLYNPEDSHLHSHRRENLNSYLFYFPNLQHTVTI